MPSSSPVSTRILLATAITVLLFILTIIKNTSVVSADIQIVLDIVSLVFICILSLIAILATQADEKHKKDLLRLNSGLKNINAKKDEFISMAAHELRGPLTAIKGFISMVIAGDSGPIGNKTKEFLEDTAVSTQRMIRLVENMLNVSRIEEGRILYHMQNFRLSKAASEIFSEFQIEAKQKNLKLNLTIAKGIRDNVYADEDRLQEVMVNFLSNAIKYTERGQVDIRITNPSFHTIRLEVTDTGPGISEVEQKKLFQKFYRIEANVGKTIGTGLGLYISRLLIKKFGGSIGVSSHEYKGSTFWFELPVKS